MVGYFHGATGHRREASELCTHLASHGYLVASPDFTGNTMADMLADIAAAGQGTPRLAPMDQCATDRPLDARFVLDQVLGGAEPELADHLHFSDNAEQGHEMLREMWKSGSFPAADPDIDLAAIAEASRPFAELCPAAHGAATVQGLCVAHMDAHLKGSADARRFIEAGAREAFAARAIDVELL